MLQRQGIFRLSGRAGGRSLSDYFFRPVSQQSPLKLAWRSLSRRLGLMSRHDAYSSGRRFSLGAADTLAASGDFAMIESPRRL